MLRAFTVTRQNLQKDGSTLLQATMIRYVESIFPVVRSIMEARPSTPVKMADPDSVRWDETMVLIVEDPF